MQKLVPDDAILIPSEAGQVFKGMIFDTYQWQQKLFDGSYDTFEMLRRPDTVNALCIVDGKILVAEDSQPGRPTMLSFPGGRVDEEDESIDAAVRREVLEETGYEFQDWRLIKVAQPHHKIEWFIYYYVAWGGKKTADQALDAGEKIIVHLYELTELQEKSRHNTGYLGELSEFIQAVQATDDFKRIPEFEGRQVDR